MFLSVFGISR